MNSFSSIKLHFSSSYFRRKIRFIPPKLFKHIARQKDRFGKCFCYYATYEPKEPIFCLCWIVEIFFMNLCVMKLCKCLNTKFSLGTGLCEHFLLAWKSHINFTTRYYMEVALARLEFPKEKFARSPQTRMLV